MQLYFHLTRACIAVLTLAAVFPAFAEPKINEKDGSAKATSIGGSADKPDGIFVPIEHAQDCAYDHIRKRLYVTTLKQLIVFDVEGREVLESIDLLGNVQGVDISPGAKFLAIAPRGGQYIYKLKLNWNNGDEMELDRIKFKADGNEPGVFSLGIGADDSVLFSTTFAGSGWVQLRRLNPDDSISELDRIRMDSVIAVSGDRQKAFIGEGNISSGPLLTYDFKDKKLAKVTELQGFYYELACSADGAVVARPERRGCDLHDAHGTKLGTLSGAAVICAAFNPKSPVIYVMRSGERNIQEHSLSGKLLSNSYSLDKPLAIKGDVRESVNVQLQPAGRDHVRANLRRVTHVNFHTYQSGRMHVAEDGKTLCALVSSGVYVFPIQERAEQADEPDNAGRKSKVKITDK